MPTKKSHLLLKTLVVELFSFVFLLYQNSVLTFFNLPIAGALKATNCKDWFCSYCL